MTVVDADNWQTLPWSAWLPLAADNHTYQAIPNTAGVYRIRAIGERSLIYIGQTGRDLRERLRALRKGVYAKQMPFNDPHTAAPNLWVWRKEAGFEYECSVVALELSTQNRQAMEDMLLWRHRVDTGHSTLCNYGRFHPSWTKSRNRKTQSRGARLADGQLNPSGGTSTSPLQLLGNPHSEHWMGLAWSGFFPLSTASLTQVSNSAGVYRILDANLSDVIYIGESKLLRNRLRAHAQTQWPEAEPMFAFATPDGMNASHRRHELEVDLIGAYYFQMQRAPACQY